MLGSALAVATIGPAPPTSITSSIDTKGFLNVTVGSPGACSCESPKCDGSHLTRGEVKTYSGAPGCA